MNNMLVIVLLRFLYSKFLNTKNNSQQFVALTAWCMELIIT